MINKNISRVSFLIIIILLNLTIISPAAAITFFSCSDTHYKETEEENANRFAAVDLINNLPGTEYPESLGGGKVDVPRGVVVLGDLIDNGAVEGINEKQWEFWIADFGVNGEGKLKFPVYEGFGNHDLSRKRLVQESIKKRNLERKNLTAISKNGLHYSWDWDGIHFVQLNLYPGNKWSPESNYGSIHDPEFALDFLIKDLKENIGDSGRPVILMHHYDPRDNWWTDLEKVDYYNAIKNYNVICIIHGHTGTGIYKWNDIDVVNDGSLPWGGVFVFHITQENELYVGQYTPEKQWRLTFRKTFDGPKIGQALEPEPTDKYELVETNLTKISWKPMKNVISQDLYFGLDYESVQNDEQPDIKDLAPDVTECKIPSSYLPLKVGTEYSWRMDQHIDENKIIKGNIWSFRTKDIAEENNITFLVVSDTHYRMDTLSTNKNNIRAMNTIAGTKLPDDIDGYVQTPRGVIHCGDCTNDSKNWQWMTFEQDYGANGEGLIDFPVYETYGNHDGSLGSVVGDGIVERNKKRENLTTVSENGLHYSWDWDDVHFVCLGVRPGIELHPYNPHHSLEFLEEDLKKNVGDSGKAVVLFHHFGFDKAHSLNWWTEEERDSYYEVISNYNIIGIFHGHSHVCEIYNWRGINIYDAPHMKWEPTRHGFFVVNITPETMKVAERKYNGEWGLFSEKKIYMSYKEGDIPAVINNANGATNIKTVTAELNGKLVYSKQDENKNDLFIYWGDQDGGTDKQNWTNAIDLGKRSIGDFSSELKNLQADTVYYYRCYVTNDAGQDWSDYSSIFKTQSAVDVNNAAGATDIKMSTAILNGYLVAASIMPTEACIYWGTSDGRSDADVWDNKVSLGDKSLGHLSTEISELEPNTVYYYRCYAENQHGSKWAVSSNSFRTEPAVKFDKAEGAVEISKTSAKLTGNLTMANVLPTNAYLYWGDNEGGIYTEKWDNKIDLGKKQVGKITVQIDNLEPSSTYYYRFFAENSAGSEWSEKTEVFTTAKDFSKWQRRMKISFKGYDKSEVLKNFPALIILGPHIEGFSYDQFASTDGGDLRFSDKYSSELKYEIEKWDIEGDSYIWIQVPLIRGSDSHIYAYWDNSEETMLPSYTTSGSVWSEGFSGVWHMSEPDVKDSMNKNNGSAKGNQTFEGIVGAAQQFPADAKGYINFSRVTSELDIEKDITIEAWVKPLSSKNIIGIITKGAGWGEYNLHLKGGSLKPSFELKPFMPDAAKAPVGKSSLQIGQWYHICGTWDRTVARLYVNGIMEAERKGKGVIDSQSHTMRIGAIENRLTPSEIDEVRISNVPRSAEWIWASWHNQFNNEDFCEYDLVN